MEKGNVDGKPEVGGERDQKPEEEVASFFNVISIYGVNSVRGYLLIDKSSFS